MPLNKTCIGKQYPELTTVVDVGNFQKYARAYNDLNPIYFAIGGGIVAPPMFGVTVTLFSMLGALTDPELHADLLHLLHGAQDMEFLNAMRPGDVITSAAKIISIETVSSGETMAIQLDAKNQRGEPTGKTLFTVFIRGRKDPAAAREPRSGVAAEPGRGEPLLTVAQTIDKDQTFRYAEASGDRNPIHVDENVAKMAGLSGIIVHGLCTMAFTSKVMIDHLCDGDPVRLKRLAVRFSRPVFPGDTIATKVWSDGQRGGRRIYAYETYNPDGRAAIRDGIAEVAS